MIRWIWFNGYGHAVISIETADQIAVWKSACGIEDDYNTEDTKASPDIREAPILSSRPFGADSCHECHGIVKRWALEPQRIPEGAVWNPPVPAHSGVMSRDDRAAALRGAEPVSMPGDGAGAPPAPARSRRTPPVETGDDLEFPDEPVAAAPVIDGALVVAPERKKRAKKPDPDEIEV